MTTGGAVPIWSHREGEEPKPMTNGRGESDFAIELRSPRRGGAIRCGAGGAKEAKGNASQQSTDRAQNRALES